MGQPRPDADPKITRRTAENAKSAIKVRSLIDRLQKNAHGELPTEMTPGQVKSAQVLLGKVLPDENRVEQVLDDTPSLTPQEIDEALQRFLLDLAQSEPAKLKSLLAAAGLNSVSIN